MEQRSQAHTTLLLRLTLECPPYRLTSSLLSGYPAGLVADNDLWISCQLPLWCVVFLPRLLLTTLKDKIILISLLFSSPHSTLFDLDYNEAKHYLCSPWILNIHAGPYSTFTWMCWIVTMLWVSTQLKIRSTHYLISDYLHSGHLGLTLLKMVHQLHSPGTLGHARTTHGV